MPEARERYDERARGVHLREKGGWCLGNQSTRGVEGFSGERTNADHRDEWTSSTVLDDLSFEEYTDRIANGEGVHLDKPKSVASA